jgi:hypothetical protein
VVAPPPIGKGLVERRLLVSREKVAFLRYVLEAHEGIGLMHGDGSGVIRLLAPESQLSELDALIADLQEDGTVDALLPSVPAVG